MGNLLDWMAAHSYLSISVGAFMCGVALFYLVMQRTRKHRKEQQ